MDARGMLHSAVSRRDETATAATAARDRLYAVIRETAGYLPQTEVVKITGYTREHIRRIVRGDTG